MSYGLTTTRFQEVDKELTDMEAYLLELTQEIHAATAPGARFSHIWLQADSALSYVRSLHAALQRENAGESSNTH